MNFNKYDNIYINVEEKFREQDQELLVQHKFDRNFSTRKEYRIKLVAQIFSLIRMYFIMVLCALGIYQKFVYSNLLLAWFKEFSKFWVGYLKNRPIDVIDFHFLRLNYRKKFQDVAHTDENNPKEFVNTWQVQANIYLLFSAVWKYAKSIYFDFYRALRYIPNNAHVLEYGCGIAPMTERLIKFAPYKNLKFTLADIKQINFLYTRWKFSKKRYVNFATINIAVADSLPLDEKYDVIICPTVFEHLPNPLETVKVFYGRLKQGGVLIFDYIKGEGSGLDTKSAVKEWGDVLNFINRNFMLIKGEINPQKSTKLTIVRKGGK